MSDEMYSVDVLLPSRSTIVRSSAATGNVSARVMLAAATTSFFGRYMTEYMTEGLHASGLIHAPRSIRGSSWRRNVALIRWLNMDSMLPVRVIDLELECGCHESSKIRSRNGLRPLSIGYRAGVRAGSDHHLQGHGSHGRPVDRV